MDNCNVHNNGQINQDVIMCFHAINGENGDNIKILNSRIHNNHGEGVGPYLGPATGKLAKMSYDNWSVNIYVDTDEGNILVDGNLCTTRVSIPVRQETIRTAFGLQTSRLIWMVEIRLRCL